MTPAQLSNDVALLYLLIAMSALVLLVAAECVYRVRRMMRHREARLKMAELLARTTLLAEAVRKGGAA